MSLKRGMSCTVIALYSYKYELGDGKEVSFDSGDQFVLLSKTNADWWRVQRNGEKPIYVPASYVQEIQDDNRNSSLPTDETPLHTYTSPETTNSDEECDRRSDPPKVLDHPVVSISDHGEPTNNSYDNVESFELPFRPKSVSGVREMAKSLEMVGGDPFVLIKTRCLPLVKASVCSKLVGHVLRMW